MASERTEVPILKGADLCTPRISPSRQNFLLFSPPSVGEEEILEVVDTLRSGWITTGPKTHRFESEFAARVQAPAALGLNSCTGALHTALLAQGVGPGDEVITTPLTFTATANVVEHVGATPVLVDVEPDTLNIRPDAVAAAITPRTKAIIAVHYAGHPADLDPLHELAQSAGAVLIEDAAHSLPASYRGRMIGSGPNPVAFSFYATKNLTTGEGGMLTASPDFIDRARVMSLHGMTRDAWRRYAKGGSWKYDVVAPGFKYNMTDIQAALGLAQLRKLGRFQQRRLEVVLAYNAAFGELNALETPQARAEVESAWHLYVLRLRRGALRIGRDQFIEELTARNIGTSVHFIPIYRHAYYRQRYELQPTMFPVTEDAYSRMLSLPLHPGLSDADVTDVIEAVRDVVARFAR
jgi:dTDP-4-amino-4,6-dideoxygalactose transaminase